MTEQRAAEQAEAAAAVEERKKKQAAVAALAANVEAPKAARKLGRGRAAMNMPLRGSAEGS